MPTSTNQPAADPQPSALGQLWNQGTAPLVNFAKSVMGSGSGDQPAQSKILTTPNATGLVNPAPNAAPSLPVEGLRALAALPGPLGRINHEVDPQVVSGGALTGRGGNAVESSVDQGAGNNTIEINDPASLRRNLSSTMAHELTHTWQNSLTPEAQAAMPEDAQDMSAFNISNVDKLRQQGRTLATLPREQAATVVQNYIQHPDQQKRLQPWINDMKTTPLSSTMPTAPDAKRLNMAPRPPGLPNLPDAMFQPRRKPLQ